MKRLLAVLCLATVAAAVFPGRASAHAFLESSSPGASVRLRSGPTVVRLRFTEAIAPVGGDRLSLRLVSGRPIPLRRLSLGSGNTALVAAVPRLRNGVYRVSWQILSADDGQPSIGDFAFAVGSNASLARLTASATAPTDWTSVALGWLFLLGLALASGGLANEVMIWRPLLKERQGPLPRRVVLAPLLLALGSALALFVRLAGTVSPREPVSGFTPAAWNPALHTWAGATMAFALIAILAALVALANRRTWIGGLPVLLTAAAAAALRTHPAAASSWWAGPTIVIHVVLAVLWAGMLGQLALVAWRHGRSMPLIATAARRYSTVALWSVAIVLLTGLIAASAVLTAPSQLLSTTYGRFLLLKGFLVVIALSCALWGRAALTNRDPARAVTLLRAGLRPEVLATGIVLGLAALLSIIAPPYVTAGVGVAAALRGPPSLVGPTVTLAGKAGWLEVYATAGRGRLTVRVMTPEDEPATLTTVHLAAWRPRASRSQALSPTPCGVGCVTAPFQWRRGTTRLRLRVESRAWSGGALTLGMPWPPLPPHRAYFRRVIARMRAVRSLTVVEWTSSAPVRSFRHVARMTGVRFLASEPYGPSVPGLRELPGSSASRQLVVYLAASNLWVRLWVDAEDRIRREVIVDPGHRIVRRFTYPRG